MDKQELKKLQLAAESEAKAFGCTVDLRAERFQGYGRQAEEVRLTIVVRKESQRGEPLTHGSNIPADQPDIEILVKEIVRDAAARLAKA